MLPRSWVLRGVAVAVCLVSVQLGWEWAKERSVKLSAQAVTAAIGATVALDNGHQVPSAVASLDQHAHHQHKLVSATATTEGVAATHTHDSAAASHQTDPSSTSTMGDDYCNTGRPMSMSMNGYQFERGSMVNCIIFLYKSYVIDSAGKYAGGIREASHS